MWNLRYPRPGAVLSPGSRFTSHSLMFVRTGGRGRGGAGRGGHWFWHCTRCTCHPAVMLPSHYTWDMAQHCSLCIGIILLYTLFVIVSSFVCFTFTNTWIDSRPVYKHRALYCTVLYSTVLKWTVINWFYFLSSVMSFFEILSNLRTMDFGLPLPKAVPVYLEQ